MSVCKGTLFIRPPACDKSNSLSDIRQPARKKSNFLSEKDQFSRRFDMKRMTFVAAVILTYAFACWSQICYEASGQTAAFTLKAGAKSGPAAIHEISVMRDKSSSGISVTRTRGSILIILPFLEHGIGDIAVYDIAGRQIYRQREFSRASLQIETWTFAVGIYTIRVQFDGQNYIRRFMVSR
jgi:hypothetical protein